MWDMDRRSGIDVRPPVSAGGGTERCDTVGNLAR
jgi:hypothetical protein